MFEECTAEGYTYLMNEASKPPQKVKLERQSSIFQVQSGEMQRSDSVGSSLSEAMGEEKIQQEVVGFDDAHPGVDNDLRYDLSYLRGDGSSGADLAGFLRRPVNIYSKDWTLGGTLDFASSSFKPWHLFFNHAAIKKKLDNYYLLKCNLKIKLVINASPFYYGGAIMTYQPLTQFNPASTTIGSLRELVPFSQRPHIYFYPQNNQGGSMTLPFFYHKEWLDATSAADLQNMGTLSFVSLDELRNANAVVGTNCTIQVYAWAEDLQLAGPTLQLAVQSKEIPIVHSKRYKCVHALKDTYRVCKCISTCAMMHEMVVQSSEHKKKHAKKDEYHHEGTISKPASAIAKLTGQLSDVPVIGPFMTATSMAADAAAGIANLFGYTDVPVIDDVHEFKNQPFPQFASTEVGIPIEKATIDAKNELSIDPKISYLDVGDELSIKSIVTRESFVNTFDWDASDTEGTLLFNFGVNPAIKRVAILSGQTDIYNTPMGYISQCFKYWRGDIKFRFKFLASQYHRGRVRITWDPHGDLSGTTDTTTTNYTKIVDITENSDVTFVVPYTQPTAYLPLDTDITDEHNSAISIFPGQSHNNGILTMRVLTEQTSPVASAVITVAAFVSGCDNLEFAGPEEINPELSPYVVQSSEMDYDGENNEEYQLGLKGSSPYPGLNLVYMGESISSMRQLLRRTTLSGYYPFDYTFSTANKMVILRSFIRRIPLLPGFDPNGSSFANGINVAGSKAYNWTPWTYNSYMSLCYVGHRGSMNWHMNFYSTQPARQLTIGRGSENLTSANYSLSTATSTSGFGHVDRLQKGNVKSGQMGISLTNQDTQTAVSIVMPMYSHYKFHSNAAATRTLGNASDSTRDDCVVATATLAPSEISSFTDGGFSYYSSIGADFTFVFFLNAPMLHLYDTTPGPPP